MPQAGAVRAAIMFLSAALLPFCCDAKLDGIMSPPAFESGDAGGVNVTITIDVMKAAVLTVILVAIAASFAAYQYGWRAGVCWQSKQGSAAAPPLPPPAATAPSFAGSAASSSSGPALAPTPTRATAVVECQTYWQAPPYGTRSIATQSQCGYKWWWQKPEFRVLPVLSQGVHIV